MTSSIGWNSPLNSAWKWKRLRKKVLCRILAAFSSKYRKNKTTDSVYFFIFFFIYWLEICSLIVKSILWNWQAMSQVMASSTCGLETFSLGKWKKVLGINKVHLLFFCFVFLFFLYKIKKNENYNKLILITLKNALQVQI